MIIQIFDNKKTTPLQLMDKKLELKCERSEVQSVE